MKKAKRRLYSGENLRGDLMFTISILYVFLTIALLITDAQW